MLHKTSDLLKCKISAVDGEVGSIADVYFDDEHWAVRYFVVTTGGWLDRHQVLISPHAVQPERSTHDVLHVDLTRERVRGSPPMTSELPVSRQYEMAHAAYYSYPYYWRGPMLWGAAAFPVGAASRAEIAPGEAMETGAPAGFGEAQQKAAARVRAAEASHLRSAAELIGYTVQARDGEVGRVDDFLLDERSWALRSVVVDTRKWLPGGQVLVPADVVRGASWARSELRLDMDRESVRHSPSPTDG